MLLGDLSAQTPLADGRLTDGERIEMQVYFKWGLLMPKAGEAVLAVGKSQFRGEKAWEYRLDFHTQGIFEKIFPMRDTLKAYFSEPGRHLLYAEKRSDEGKYYSVDELSFSYGPGDVSEVHSIRYTLQETKIDTVLRSEGPLLDMLSATMYLRALDWTRLSIGDTWPFHIAVGRDLVPAAYRYAGQQIVEHGGVKYRTRHFYIDVHDEAFTQSRAAGEVWIGDDPNHVPVKVRAKLKIGAAEVYFRQASGLPYPLECAVGGKD